MYTPSPIIVQLGYPRGFTAGLRPMPFVENGDARTTLTRRIGRVSRDPNPSPKAEFKCFVTFGIGAEWALTLVTCQ